MPMKGKNRTLSVQIKCGRDEWYKWIWMYLVFYFLDNAISINLIQTINLSYCYTRINCLISINILHPRYDTDSLLLWVYNVGLDN
jgi:hypothetical protein